MNFSAMMRGSGSWNSIVKLFPVPQVPFSSSSSSRDFLSVRERLIVMWTERRLLQSQKELMKRVQKWCILKSVFLFYKYKCCKCYTVLQLLHARSPWDCLSHYCPLCDFAISYCLLAAGVVWYPFKSWERARHRRPDIGIRTRLWKECRERVAV